MRIKLLSKRYATAMFDLAVENKILEKVNSDLLLVAKVFRENREFRLIIGNPVIDSYKKINIFDKLFDGKVQELTIRFLKLITKKGRERYIPYIADAFHDIYNESKNILSINVTTAVKADSSIIEGISDKLHEVTKMNIDVNEKINEKLIGGFVINFQDYKYDASIVNQLNILKKEFFG